MVYALDIIDEMIVLTIINEINALLETNNSLQEKVYYLISFKPFVHTSNEHKIDYPIMFVFNHFIIFDIFYVNLFDHSGVIFNEKRK